MLKTNRVKPNPDSFSELTNKETEYFQNVPAPATLFLLTKPDADCQTLERKYGYVVLGGNNLAKARFLFSFALRTFTKKNSAYTDWSFIEPFRHPFNAMVIADNYILKDSDLIKQNLLPFLKNFLPERLDHNAFQLTILTMEVPNLKQRYQDLSQQLKQTFPYPVHICIVKCNKDELHDRNILTNYFWLSSGYGFALFNKNGNVAKDTHVSLFSRFYPNQSTVVYDGPKAVPLVGQQAVSTMCNTLGGIFKGISSGKPKNIGYETYVCGERTNRLLS
ncbi:hypothetical protein GCM10023187_08710 [Nibrella viscosa]|uniref:Uncharacterized protein n=1 Tax=Nibrella viscosa TaxID=1084524 RepID=A0ABP8JZ69_9BACT